MRRLMVVLLLVAALDAVSAPEEENPRLGHQRRILAVSAPDNADPQNEWFLILGSMNLHPRLSDASRRIDREINQPLRLLAPNFRDIRTFSDQRDELAIWSNVLGVGRVLSPRWSVFAQTGYTAGTVRSRALDGTWFLLPLSTHVELRRSSFYLGVGANFYPFGMPEQARYTTLRARLAQARPFLAGSMNWNRMTFDAEIKAGPWPLSSVFRQTVRESWTPWSLGAAVGVEVPLSQQSSLSLLATYNHFLSQRTDFSGPSFNIIWKRRF